MWVSERKWVDCFLQFLKHILLRDATEIRCRNDVHGIIIYVLFRYFRTTVQLHNGSGITVRNLDMRSDGALARRDRDDVPVSVGRQIDSVTAFDWCQFSFRSLGATSRRRRQCPTVLLTSHRKENSISIALFRRPLRAVSFHSKTALHPPVPSVFSSADVVS